MSKPKILLWDIENTPALGYSWQKYDTNIISFKEDWYILSFAYKWLGQKTTHVVGLNDFPNYKRNKRDDKQLCLVLRDLLDEADVTIAHNGDAFDMRKANARFLINGIDLPSPSRQIDTLRIARRVAMFTSNKLGDLGESLGLGGKADTGGFETWLGCMEGSERAWKILKKYNKADVDLLEKVYYKLRPWAPAHPNLSLMAEMPDSCPRCGVPGQMWRRGKRPQMTRIQERFQCQACRGYSTGTRTLTADEAPRPLYKVP